MQIIKGWLADDGTTRERVYNVAWSGLRTIDPVSGELPSLPSTVNEKKASYENSTGEATLAGLWSDPDFDATQSAFYYLRVLQIMTPRWTSYDAVRYGVQAPADVPGEIWYTPER